MNSEASCAQYMAFDPTCYPRTYPPSLVWRLFFIFLGIAIGAGLPYLVLSASGRGTSGSTSILWLLPLPLGGIYLILWVRRFKVVLRPDAIESHRSFSTRRIIRSEIKEKYNVSGNGRGAFSQLVLVPRDGNAKELRILMILDNDVLFHAWFAAIPDANYQERASIAR
jgi:hypothetical protein